MDFIITYNISDNDLRYDFEKIVSDSFHQVSKETNNQTTIIGKSSLNIEQVINKLEEKVNNLKTGDNDTVTFYYPTQIDGKLSISKKEILSLKILENLENEKNRMKYLMHYSSFIEK